MLLTGGSEQIRDLPVPGRELDGVHFAMEFLPQQNKVVAGDKLKGQITATGKHVIVIGGGDTGSDCVGTSNRHGAASVTQFELMPQPPEEENRPLTWPYWPTKLRTSSSHEEGCEREFAIATKEFIGGTGKDKGKVTGLKTVHVEMAGRQDGRGARHREGIQGRPGAAGDGLRRPGGHACSTPSASSEDARGNAKATHRRARRLPHQRRQGVRRRRHAPRPEPGGLGHPRRPPGGARGRRVPDGRERRCRAEAGAAAARPCTRLSPNGHSACNPHGFAGLHARISRLCRHVRRARRSARPAPPLLERRHPHRDRPRHVRLRPQPHDPERRLAEVPARQGHGRSWAARAAARPRCCA